MSQPRFWVSTGDIHERYEVLTVIGVLADASFLTMPDLTEMTRKAVDALAVEAQKIGANGVIWIDVKPFVIGGLVAYATGTAVIVKPSS